MSYNDQIRKLAQRYYREREKTQATTHEIAEWAIQQGLWKPKQSDLVDRFADEIARALREEYFTDEQGRTVRAKHAARVEREGQQVTLWADMRTAPRKHMRVAFQQRRHQIVGDCTQLKFDVDSFNENFSGGEVIQMSFDFTKDLAEIEAAATV